MSFNGILKRASSFLGLTSSESSKPAYDDGDIVFSKNNVCVHPPSRYRGEGEKVHHPGYLVIKCVADVTLGTTLHLSWIPNDRLRRNHELISQVNHDTSSRSNSPSESLSVSSLVLHEGNTTGRKTSEDDNATMSTSGVSTLDTSETKEENTSSPNSEGSYDEKRKSGEISDEGLGSEKISETKALEDQAFDDNSKTSESESALPESDQFDSGEGLEDIETPIGNEDKCLGELLEKSDPVSDDYEAKDIDKVPESVREKYVSTSSSDSSSDGDKLERETDTTEKTDRSYPIGQTNSELEDSLDSSPEPQMSPPSTNYFPTNSGEQYWYERSAESMAYSANLAFPESFRSSSSPTPLDGGSSPIRREHKCGIFSVDVSQSKSLRLFFSDKDRTCGQLVIASVESQYKIFHFHHGGLDKLASVFEDWNFLVKPREEEEEVRTPDSALKLFLVCKPHVTESELHPEEGRHECLDTESWVTYFSKEGVIEDDLKLRRAIFYGGVDPQLRANVWSFLLHYYDFRTTFVERQSIMEEKHQLYQKINTMRESMIGDEKEKFRRNIQYTVEKDVVRTDRFKAYFAGKGNPNLDKMTRILLNFAVHNPIMGYTQGMSDILAPILAEIRNEADAFWCFTGLMSKTIFVTSPKDEDMEKNLSYLRELMRLMTPRFFNHIASQQDGMDLLFCHRWILLCFKREFPEDEALSMWEACWSNYQTDYFHLFLVVAIISKYGNDVVDQNLKQDETLLYFTSLANHMDGQMVLKKARGLLHQYRSMSHLPCTLVGLCELCGPGMWDSGHVPVVACIGHDGDAPCPLSKQSSSGTHTNTNGAS